jgi:type VI secretion system protein ImpE
MADPGRSAEELFRAGELDGAIEAATSRVRKSPLDQDARYQLFIFLCYAGELERADKQLAVLAEQDERAGSGSLVYHALLSAEVERRQVYEGDGRPTLPPDAPEFARLRVEAIERLRAGDLDGATAKTDEAIDATPRCPGKLNGEAFTDLRDYDDVLGSVIEIFAGGRYIWMPLTGIKRLDFEEPRTALDTLWRPARIEGTDGVTADVHLPALYAPSYAADHDAIRLGRLTDWRERGDLYTGVGQHLFLSIRGGERFETSLMDFRHLEIDDAG